MRRAFMMAGMMTVVFLAVWGRPAMVSATQTCTATCSAGSTLTCTAATGTCSSASGTVTCCNQTLTCGPINAWDTCQNNCDTQHDNCVNSCGGRAGSCLTNCNTALRTCWTHCGAQPPKSFSC
jgi:hypothetical protein